MARHARSIWILLCLIFVHNIDQVKGAVTAVNDIASTAVNIPICVSVLSNDNWDSNPSVVAVTNGTKGGFAFTSYPPMFIADSTNVVVAETENYQQINFRDYPNYQAAGNASSWQFVSNSLYSGLQGTGGVRSWPNTGVFTSAGPAIRYDIGFLSASTTYKLYVRGQTCMNCTTSCASFCSSSSAATDDSLHYLVGPGTPVFMSNSGYVGSLGQGWPKWQEFSPAFTVTNDEVTWPPTPKPIYLAMREDGSVIDRFYIGLATGLTNSGNILQGTKIGPNATQFLNCSEGQLVYFPAKGYIGSDNVTYTINDGAASSTGIVTVYVGVSPPPPSPSPSITPSPSSSPSVTPSVTPSNSPTPSPSLTPTPSITPSQTPSSSPTPSPSVTPTPSPSVTPTSSVTPSLTPSPSVTPTPSVTPSTTPTPSVSPTPSVTPSRTPSPSVSPSLFSSPSPTPSITPSTSVSSSVTPSISVSPSVTPSLTPTPSVTPSVTPSSSPSRTPSTSPSSSSSPSPTASVTPSVTPSPSPTSSVTPSLTPSTTPSPSPSSSVTPTASVTASTTPSNTPSPSITPSTTPSPIPSPDADKSSDSGSNLGIAVGLGLGLPLCAIGIGVGAFITVRKRRGDEDPEAASSVPLLPPVPEPSDERLASFEQLLLEDGYRLVKAMTKYTQITEADKIASWLVFDFEFNGLTIDLIKSLISREVKMANHAGSLMRANSMASKMMKSLSGLIAKPYLKMMFLETIEEICRNPTEGGASFEVDPHKVPPTESLEKNQQKLQLFTSKFLRKIFESADQAPLEFRQICNALQKRVSIKFPESSQTSVGGFLFLRVYCPAIVAPSGFGIITSAPNAQAQRGLTLIAKTLQNIANNVNFGNKEVFMTYLNPFITNNFSACQDYFDEMATITLNAQPANTELRNITPEKREKALKDLYRHMRTIYPKMKDKYTGKNFFDRFYQIAKEDISQDEVRKQQIQGSQVTQPTHNNQPQAEDE